MSGARRPAIAAAPRDRDLALSFAQERLWFLAQLDPRGPSLNAPFVIELRGELDVPALHRALREIVRRHEALRTTYVAGGGRPVQRVAAGDVEVALTIDALDALPERERSSALERLARQEFSTGFDLEAGPVYRLRLVRLAERDHRLLLVVHHIAWDAWSFLVFVRELGALYPALAGGADPALPELAVQVADHARWQRDALDDAALADHLAYWKGQLAGAPPVLELPGDRLRPPVLSLRGGRLRRTLPAELSRALRDLARTERVTSFMALLAGFSALLNRYTGCDDLVVGSATAGRNRREVEPLIGLFINTVPLRVDCAGGPSFRELLARARAVCVDAFAHQDMPFERLVALGPAARDPGRMPLFQVFIGQRPAWPALELPGLSVRTDDAHFGSSLHDLSLHLQDAATEVTATWEFADALFDEGTIARMHAQWTRLLAAAVAEPDRPIAELTMISVAERDTVLIDWNPPAPPRPAVPLLHEQFEAQVERTPDAPAAVFGDVELSYRELDRRAARVARRLRALGAGMDARVAVCTADPLDAIIAILGILKAGAAYVALDPTHPADRLRTLVGDVRPIAVLGRRAPGIEGVPVLPVEDAGAGGDSAAPPAGERGAEGARSARVPPEALAYIIHTSGSTGRPKGVMISHGAVTQRLEHARSYFALGEGDTSLQAASPGFDASVLEIFTALTSGARLALIAPADRADPERLVRAFAAHRVSFAFVVPSMLPALLDAGLAEAATHLRWMACGGEAIPRQLRDRFLERGAPSARLVNVYGPTECTIYVTLHTFGAGDAGRTVVLGRPLGASRAYVLDGGLQPVPAGVSGEIWVGGETLARGYLDRDALTAERFVADPFSTRPGARMYRTGDLGRWSARGELEYLGRVDDQVKIHGVRIELGEIEAALLAQPEVSQAAVAVRDDTGDRRLVAYVVPRAGAPLAVDAVRRRLSQVLPRTMMPGAIVLLERLPLTRSGKVDRRALPAPSDRRADLGGNYVAPEGDLEEAISRIWAEVLGVDRVGASDNFFDLGGSSLLLGAVRSRLEGLVGRPVPMVTLLQFAQVRSLAEHLTDSARTESEAAPAPIPPARPAAARTDGRRRLADQRRGRGSGA